MVFKVSLGNKYLRYFNVQALTSLTEFTKLEEFRPHVPLFKAGVIFKMCIAHFTALNLWHYLSSIMDSFSPSLTV